MAERSRTFVIVKCCWNWKSFRLQIRQVKKESPMCIDMLG